MFPVFKSLHPTLYDMKSDLKESIEQLTGRLDKIYSYDCGVNVGNILFYNLLYKYRSKCFVTQLKEPTHKDIQFFDKTLLGLYINPNIPFEKLFTKEYIHYLGNKLLSCVSKSKNVILMHLIIYSEKDSSGHSNMLIYKPDEKNVYRFEPHGVTYVDRHIDNTINEYLHKLFETEISLYVEDDITYIKPLEICPVYNGIPELRGLQGFEMKGETESHEGDGYCMMWSLLFAEMVLLNPNKPLIEIMNELFLITNKNPIYLRNIIRGYVKLCTDILKQLSETLFKHKINSYDEFSNYLKKTKDSKNTILLNLLTLFTEETRANSPNGN